MTENKRNKELLQTFSNEGNREKIMNTKYMVRVRGKVPVKLQKKIFI